MSELRRPRWIFLSLLIVGFVIGSVTLGFWQLRRLDVRRIDNAVVAARLDADTVDMATLTGFVTTTVAAAELEYTRVDASGVLLEKGRVRVRSQVHNGQAGTHHVHPLDLGDGTAVLVNIGWVPLGAEPPTLDELYGSGPLPITGVVRATQTRPSLGRQEPEGVLDQVARIDIDRLQRQVDLTLQPFWIQLIGPDDPETLPVPTPLPALDDGPHLSYAVQWFSFALIAIGGYAALVRRELKKGRRGRVRRDPQ